MAWSTRTRRIIAVAMLVIAIIASVGYALRGAPDTGRLHLLHGLAIFDTILWAFALPRGLLLANEAYRLRLPGLGRRVVASTLLYAVLTIAAPAMLLALAGGSASVALTELALGAGIGMGYGGLPMWLGFWACLTPMLDNHAGDWLPMPASQPAGFLHWAAPVATVVWTLIVLGWRHAVRCDDDTARWFSPAVLRWRRLAVHGRHGTKLEAELLRRRNARWQPRYDLRHTGPSQAARSLRVALGGWAVPQMPTSLLRQLGQALLGIAFVGAVLIAMQYLSRGLADATAYAIVLAMFAHAPALALGLSLFCAMAGFVRADALRARWSRDNAELPLLALLPGLGNAQQAKRTLLHAGLGPTLILQAALLAGVLGLAIWQQLPTANLALLLLALGSAMLATVALCVASLGGTALHPGWQSVLTIAASVLIITTCSAALFRFGDNALAEHLIASAAFFALWAALLATLLMIGLRGWRAFTARPHPFLPTLG